MNKILAFLKRYPLLCVCLYFLGLTVLMTWPLILRMENEMIGRVGDNIYFVWMIGWFKKALFELHVNPFDLWFLNYPEGWSLAYTEITPIQLLIALPFTFIGGPTFAYNAAMLLSFALSGLGMFLWVRRLTGNQAAALAAGTGYAFLPFHFAHFLIGHLNLSGLQWFPFYFMGFFELLQMKKFSWRSVLLTGVFLGLIALTSQYYLFMSLIISAFAALVYLLFMERPQLKNGQFWKALATAGLVSLPLVLAASAPYILLLGQGGLPDRNLGIVRPYSASPTDFILPSTDHFLWGAWVGEHFNRDMWVEGTLYIGLASAALAALAFAWRKWSRNRALLALMGWSGLLALILAMGTDVHWNGAPVEIPTPGFLSGFTDKTSLPIPLPGYVLFLYFPLYAKLRAFMRFGVYVLVFIQAAAGIGLAGLLERIKPSWRTAAAVAALALILFDFYPGPYSEFTSVQARPVDSWLAQQTGAGAVAQMPFSIAEDQEHTYYTLVHGKPYIGGFFNAFPPAQYARIMPVLEHFPDQASVDLLSELGVEYVLVDPCHYKNADETRRGIEHFGLEYVTEQGGMWVFGFGETQ
jgi:4-amino-4-deoxy-L-arabinose transferase-like glycosyltransferase